MLNLAIQNMEKNIGDIKIDKVAQEAVDNLWAGEEGSHGRNLMAGLPWYLLYCD